MAKIVDPDDLNQSTEVVIATGAKTVQLLPAGNLNDASPGATSGVTMQAVYSFLKEEWKADNALNKFKFPLKSFTKNEFQWINGWSPADAQTRTLLRDAGWSETVATENGDIYAGLISLGQFDATADQGYYANVAGFDQTTADFDKTGNVNEAILVFDASGTDNTGYLKAFLREQGKLYASYNLLAEQGISALEATLYRFPLGGNTTDLDVSESDSNIDSIVPYTGMNIRYYAGVGFNTWAIGAKPAESVVQDSGGRWWFTDAGGTSAGNDTNLGGGSDTGVTWVAFEGEKLIGAIYYAFNTVIEGNSGTRYEIYEYAMRQLRQTSDINTGTIVDANQDTVGTVNGNIADEIAGFRGSDLVLKSGIYIDNFGAAEINNIVFVPIPVDGGVDAEVTFPFEVVVTINFPANVVGEVDADVRGVAYFTNDDAGNNAGNDFDTSGAIIAQDNSPANVDFDGTDLVGSSFIFSYDYDGNVQRGGGSGGADAPITLQLCGLAAFEIGTTEFSIGRTATLTVNVVASDERNYANA